MPCILRRNEISAAMQNGGAAAMQLFTQTWFGQYIRRHNARHGDLQLVLRAADNPGVAAHHRREAILRHIRRVALLLAHSGVRHMGPLVVFFSLSSHVCGRVPHIWAGNKRASEIRAILA